MTNIPPGAARAVADLSSGIILASVEIAAPPERVFRAMASPEVAEWWGSPDTYRVTRWTGDVRVGGRWLSEGIGANGQPFAVGGEFLVVEPPRLIVQTWAYDRAPSEITTITTRIDAIPSGSRVTVRHEGFTDESSCAGHATGWERVLGWMTAYVTRPGEPCETA